MANLTPFLTEKISFSRVLPITFTDLWSSPTIETLAGTSIGLVSTYVPERTLTVDPDVAIPTAALIVNLALSIDVPLLSSSPSLAT